MSESANLSFIASNTKIFTSSYGTGANLTAGSIFVNDIYFAANNLPWSGGGGGGGSISINDETTNSSSYYPLLATVTTGTLSTANTSSTKLYFQPSTGTLSATIFSSLSDETQKININVIQNSLEITENINGVTFDWIDGSGSSAGLIAQDVEKYLPELILIKEDGTKSLNYNGIIGVLVESIKDLSERVKKLESK